MGEPFRLGLVNEAIGAQIPDREFVIRRDPPHVRRGYRAMSTESRYTIITTDSHAGGSHAHYREYLDPEFLEDFDAWRGRYKNPFRDLGNTSDRVRNWDTERRWHDMESDGIVAEDIFFTRETLQQVFAGAPQPELRGILAENAASLYGFDLGALAPPAKQHGPTISEIAEPFTELPPNPNRALHLATVAR